IAASPVVWLGHLMTVQYSLPAATAYGTAFLRLLLLWRGSVWKLVVIELLIWALGCTILTAVFLFVIERNEYAESEYCNVLEHMDQLPFKSTLTVILGFTALTCVQRWMDVYNLLVWPENVALMFNSWFRDEALAPEEARIVRHSVYRYLLLTYILLLRDVSIPIKKQFPTYQHLIQGKLLTKEELELMESSNIDPNYCRYWMPLLWLCQLVKKYYKSGRSATSRRATIMEEAHFGKFINEISRVRGLLGDILSYDWIPMPLANTQTITFAVYSYLIVDGILQDYPLCQNNHDWSIMATLTRFGFSLLLNTFYLGWLKCAQVILNPFGLDDDDFEACALIDMYQRSLAAIFTRPETLQPVGRHTYGRLPHTVGSALMGGTSETSLVGSMAHKTIPRLGQEVIRRRR
ncbi:hypothetical protein V3C99_010270, partial [Haemonchus contortus]